MDCGILIIAIELSSIVWSTEVYNEQGPVSVSTRICPDCTHMTWCVGQGTSACASWSLGTCLAVTGAGMQTDVKSASSSRQQVLEVDGCFQTMPTRAAAAAEE